MKILIADSNEDTVAIAKECLKYFGECEITNKGQTAFKLVKEASINKTPYDLIFSNIEMTEITGLTLLRMVRAYEESFELRKKTKFILVTEHHKNRTWIGKDDDTVIIEPLSYKCLIDEVFKIGLRQKEIN